MKTLLMSLCLGAVACLGLLVSNSSIAADCAADCASGAARVCAKCGCNAPTRKVCRVVEGVEKKSKVSYSTECQDFCIPGKSEFCGYKTECGPCGTKKLKKVWKPTCGEAASKRMLVKTTKSEEEKTHKYEVVEVCNACSGHGRCHGCSSGSCGHQGACDANGCAKATGDKQDQVAAVSLESEESEVAPEPALRVEPVSFPERAR
jgi:hypothetical protein